MIPDVMAVRPLDGYRLRLVFDDGTEGDVDVAELVAFTGVFEPLREPTRFRSVKVDPETGTISWPNGADLDPVVLYSKVTGRSIDELRATASRRMD